MENYQSDINFVDYDDFMEHQLNSIMKLNENRRFMFYDWKR
jgi:hypothetical protein